MIKKGLLLFIAVLIFSSCAPEAEHVRLPDSDLPPPQSSDASHTGASPASDTEEAAPSFVQQLALALTQSFLREEMEPEEMVRAAYRYLVERVSFADPVGLDAWRYLSDDDNPIPYLENRALSPLLFQIGSCEDFAAAMVLLLRASGFEAEYVAGYTLSVEQVYIDHAWAVVKLQGEWYHLDPQLEQNIIKDNRLTYRYYLRSDEEFATDHKWGENLIAFWSDMPDWEKEQIRREYTPPPCPQSGARPEWESVPLPQKPNMSEVEAKIYQIKSQSPRRDLPPIYLNVEPPVLVAEHHITPPLIYEMPDSAPYGRSLLEGQSASFYDSLKAVVEAMRAPVTVPVPAGLGNTEALHIAETLAGDEPAYYWVTFALQEQSGNRALALSFFDDLIFGEVEEQRRKLQERTGQLLAQVQNASQLEKALYIHDYLAREIRYDRRNEGKNSGNVYGALVEGTAFCDGYAKSFQYLAGMAGLEAAYIKGSSQRGIPHAWNTVKLGGEWYYVDATWDRPTGRYDDVYHDYFVVSLDEISKEHIWDRSQYSQLPQSDAGLPGYYEMAGYAVGADTGGDWTPALADVFFRQLCAKNSYPVEMEPVFLEIKVVGDNETYRRWKEHYVKNVFSILQEMERRAAEDRMFEVSYDTSVRCDFNDSTQVLTFYPKVRSR